MVRVCGGWWRTGFVSSQPFLLFINGHWPCCVFWGISTASTRLCRMWEVHEGANLWSCDSIPLPATAMCTAMLCGSSHSSLPDFAWILPGWVGLLRQVQDLWFCPPSSNGSWQCCVVLSLPAISTRVSHNAEGRRKMIFSSGDHSFCPS